MSIISNSVNYATPFYSGITEENFVDNTKYFSLHDNRLDGSYKLLGRAAGPLWSAAVSDATGKFASPIVATVTDSVVIHALHLMGDAVANVYPTGFTYTLYNGSSVVYQNSFTNNSVDWLFPLDKTYEITHYSISVSKINKPNYTLRLTNLFNTHLISRSDAASIGIVSTSTISLLVPKASEDSISIAVSEGKDISVHVVSAAGAPTNLTTSTKIESTLKSHQELAVVVTTASTILNNFLRSSNILIVANGVDVICNSINPTSDMASLQLIPDVSDVHAMLNRADSLGLGTNNFELPTTIENTLRSTSDLRLAVPTLSVVQNSFATALNVALEALGAMTVANAIDPVTDTVTLRLAPDLSNLHALLFRPDTLYLPVSDTGMVRNVHTRMKDHDRHIYGKAVISYMNPLLDDNFIQHATSSSSTSRIEQIQNAKTDTGKKLFFLFDNKLDGSCKLIGENTEVGWWSGTLSDMNGVFVDAPVVTTEFSPRLLRTLNIISSKEQDLILVDFDVNVLSNGALYTYNILGNRGFDTIITDDALPDVTKVEVVVHKISRPFYAANIMEVTVGSTVTYTDEDLISIDLLEELSYKDEIESLGGVSANEITVTINNDNHQFYFNNPASLIAKQLKKNRKIVSYLGVDITPGIIEWYKLGTYWSYSWDVPVRGLSATVVGFDTIGLLGTTDFYDHQVYENYSVGQLIEVVLLDAKNVYSSLEWQIDDRLY